MRSLIYEIASGTAGLAGTVLEYGLWRATVGVSDAELLRGTLACAGFGCCFALAAYPGIGVSARENSGAAFAVLPVLDRGIIWLFKQRWFTAMRKGLLATTAIGSFVLILLTPGTRSQQEDPFSIPRVVARHESDIAALRETVQEIRLDVRVIKLNQDNVIRTQNDFFFWLKCIGVAVLTTIIGLVVTRYYYDAERGRIARENTGRKPLIHNPYHAADDEDSVV